MGATKLILVPFILLLALFSASAAVVECGSDNSGACEPGQCPSGSVGLTNNIHDNYGSADKSVRGYRLCSSTGGEVRGCEGSTEGGGTCSPPACPSGMFEAGVYEGFHSDNKIVRKYRICLNPLEGGAANSPSLKSCEGSASPLCNLPACENGKVDLGVLKELHGDRVRQYRLCESACSPSQPTLKSPAEAQTFQASTQQVTLEWEPVAGATYDLRVNVDTLGKSIAKDSRNNCNQHFVCINSYNSNSITVNVQPGVAYSWWVHVRKPCGVGNLAGRNFRTGQEAAVPTIRIVASADQGNGLPLMQAYRKSGNSFVKFAEWTVDNYRRPAVYEAKLPSGYTQGDEIAVVFPNDYYSGQSPSYVLQSFYSKTGDKAWNRRCSFKADSLHGFESQTCSRWNEVDLTTEGVTDAAGSILSAADHRLTGFDAYFYDGSDGKKYLVRTMIHQDGKRAWRNKCQYDPTFPHSVNPATCTPWELWNLASEDTKVDSAARAYSDMDNFIFADTGGRKHIVQSLTSKSGSLGFNRECDYDGGNAYGYNPSTCSGWRQVNMADEDVKGPNRVQLAASDKVFAGIDTYLFTDSSSKLQMVQSLVHNDGRRGWNRVCHMEGVGLHGIDASKCTAWNFVDISQETVYNSDGTVNAGQGLFAGFDTFSFSLSGPTDRNLIVDSITIGSETVQAEDPARVFYDKGNSEAEWFDNLYTLSARELISYAGSLRIGAGRQLTVRAKGQNGAGWPHMAVFVNSQFLQSWSVNSDQYADYSVPLSYTPGQEIAVVFPDDYETAAVKWVVQSFVGSDKRTVYHRRCPLRNDGYHPIDGADCEAYRAVDVTGISIKDKSGNSIPDANQEFIGHDKYVYTVNGKEYIVQTFMDKDGVLAFRRKCEVLPDSMFGTTVQKCGEVKTWDLSELDTGLDASARKYRDLDNYVFTNSQGRQQLVLTLIQQDGKRYFNRFCVEDSSEFGFGGCSAFSGGSLVGEGFKDAAGNDISPADSVFSGFDAIAWQKADGSFNIIHSLIHSDGQRSWNRVCRVDPADPKGLKRGAGGCDDWRFVPIGDEPSGAPDRKLFANDNFIFTSNQPGDRDLLVDYIVIDGNKIEAEDFSRVIYDKGAAAAAFDGSDIVPESERRSIGPERLKWAGAFRITQCRTVGGVCCGDDNGETIRKGQDGCMEGCCTAGECYDSQASRCVASGGSLGSAVCSSGSWVSKSKFVASMLLDFKAKRRPEAALVCGPYGEVLNRYDYLYAESRLAETLLKSPCPLSNKQEPCVTDLCVLEHKDSGASFVAFGGAISSHYIVAELNSIVNDAQRQGYSCTSSQPAGLTRCYSGYDYLFLDSSTGVFFYNNAGFSPASEWNSIRSAASELRKGSGLQKLYSMSAASGKKIEGSVTSGCSGSSQVEQLSVSYDNFNTDFCAASNAIQQNSCSRSGSKQVITASRSPGTDSRLFDAWTSLTSGLRVK